MEIRFCVKGKERKALAAAIGEIINQPVIYEGTPSFGYKIGSFSIDRDGTLTYDETDADARKALLDALDDRGFVRIIEGGGAEYCSDASDSAVQEEEAPPIVWFGERPSPYRDGFYTDGPHENDVLNNTRDDDASVFIEPFPDAFSIDTPQGRYYVSERFDAAADAADARYKKLCSAHDGREIYSMPSNNVFGIQFAMVGAPLPPEDETEPGVFKWPAEFVLADMEPSDSLTIEMPLEGFTDASIENLRKMVASKETLIMKAIGVYELTIEKTDTSIRFPWFPASLGPDEVDAYIRLVSALCAAAKEQKRVTATEKPVENEKFAFRVFLIRLGFVGDEFKSARKILLRNLTGNSAFKNGAPPRIEATPEA